MFGPSILSRAHSVLTTHLGNAFNTNAATGDGLRHFAYQNERKFYNGVTLDDIHGDHKSTVNGIHGASPSPACKISTYPSTAWAEKGIVGRGILLDYHTWRQEQGIPHHAFKAGVIKLEQLKAVAKAQGTEIKFGDILIIRSGEFSSRIARSSGSLTLVRIYGGVQRNE